MEPTHTDKRILAALFPESEDALGNTKASEPRRAAPSHGPKVLQTGKCDSVAPHDGAQTGPKGVIADFEYAARTGSVDQLIDALEAESTFLEQYTARRRAELAGQARPTYRHVKDVNYNSFTAEVEHAHPESAVLVHLYHPDVVDCNKLNKLLVPLAEKFIFTKFLRINVADKDISIDPIALPILQLYRGGDLALNIANIPPCHITLEEFLISEGLLSESDCVNPGQST